MAQVKITALTALTAADSAATDVLPIVDVSADATKKLAVSDLHRSVPDGTLSAPGIAFQSDLNSGLYRSGTDAIALVTNGAARILIDATGNVTIPNDLTVQGATTFITGQTVLIEDKNIELGVVSTPTNITADGGGITLKGTTDKTIQWVNSTGAWTFNQPTNFNNHVRIDSSGRLLVGGASVTENDHANIDANGTLTIRRSSGEAVYVKKEAATRLYISADGGVNSFNNALGFISYDATFEATSYRYAQFVATSSEAQVVAGAVGSLDTPLVFKTSSSGTEAERLKITSTGSAEFKGSVLGSNIDVSSSSGKNGWKLSGSSSTDLTGKLELQCKTGAASSTKVFEVFNGSTSTSSIAKDGSATFTGNVGIGGTATGNFGAIDKGVLITGSDAQVGLRVHTSNGSSGILEIYAENGGSMLDTRGSGHIRVGSAATEFMRIDSSGRVGIGTSSPDEKLVVADVAASSGFSQTSVKALRSNYGGQISGYIDQGVGHGLTFSTVDSGTASERMRIDSSGRLLVGTPSFTGEASAVLEGSSAGGTTQAQLWLNRGSTPTTDNVLGQIIFGDNNAAGRNGAMIQARADLSWNTNDYPSRLAFFTTADGASSPTERMRIDSSGNVGIGTTSFPANGTNLKTSDGTIARHILEKTGSNARIFEIGNGGTFLNIYDATADSERLRIDSSGRLLVGTSSARNNFFNGFSSWTPQHQIETAGSSSAGIRSVSFTYGRSNGDAPIFAFAKHRSDSIGGTTVVQSGDGVGVISFQASDGTDFVETANISVVVDGTPGANDMPGRLVFRTTADGASGPTERMRIKSTGEVKITQDGTSNALFLHNTGTSAGRRISVIKGGTTNTSDTTTKLISFERNDGSEIGKIRRGGFSSVAYDTSSDYRIKSNVVSLTGAIDRVKEFNPIRFNWLEDTSDTPIVVDGFLAHEAQTVVPEAVSGYKNEVDEEGNPVIQGIDQSKLVPLLTAALQEAIAKIETLEASNADLLARVTALEGA